MIKIYKIISKILISIMILSSIGKVASCLELEHITNEEINKFIVCIDPGHQGKGDNKLEPVAPGSCNKKPRVTSGTSGIATKKAEHVVNLEASIKLKKILEEKGYEVIMTRESADINISNKERAEVANAAHANMTIRIHCDSINDGGKTGATILVPAKGSKYTSKIYDESNRFGTVLCKVMRDNGIKVNGVFERNDITGFNWSEVPVVILEMGFMSNYNEDLMLSDENYQQKLMNCVLESLEQYKNC